MPPRYKSGWKELVNYLEKNTRYPVFAQENRIQGTITVDFCLDKHGKINDLTILKALDPDTDKRMIEAVKSIPNVWLPAIRDNKYIDSYATVNFHLKLEYY